MTRASIFVVIILIWQARNAYLQERPEKDCTIVTMNTLPFICLPKYIYQCKICKLLFKFLTTVDLQRGLVLHDNLCVQLNSIFIHNMVDVKEVYIARSICHKIWYCVVVKADYSTKMDVMSVLLRFEHPLLFPLIETARLLVPAHECNWRKRYILSIIID